MGFLQNFFKLSTCKICPSELSYCISTLPEEINMKTVIEIIKFFAALSATLCGLACLAGGVFCLYGGPDGAAFCTNAFVGAAIGVGVAAIMALLTLALYRFAKRLLLTLLILHEIILFFWLALMGVATAFSKAIPQIMVHPIILITLLAGGYGIFKTVKAIKAESEK